MSKEILKKYLPLQMKKAKQLGLDFIERIEISPIKQKKYRVFLSDGTYVDYGFWGLMKDGTMSMDFLEHKDPVRRQKFLNRWSSNPNIDNPHSAVFYILRLTW